jgi:hypothetical protein
MDNKEFETAKSPKKPYKFNITDAFLILIIIIAASVLIYIVLGTGLFTGGEEVTIEYTIDISLIKNELVPAINRLPGEKITDSIRGYDIGEIHQVRISEANENADNKIDGIIVETPYPNHSRVLLIVRAKARKDSKGINYLVNGKLIIVGSPVHFRTQHFVGYGNCITIDEIKED